MSVNGTTASGVPTTLVHQTPTDSGIVDSRDKLALGQTVGKATQEIINSGNKKEEPKMSGDIFSGLIGGLFGDALARWAGKYRYLTIFLTVTIGVHVLSFIQDLIKVGGYEAFSRLHQFTFTPVGLLAPAAVGLIAVLCVLLCAVLTPNKKG
jgi:hypothetical protein